MKIFKDFAFDLVCIYILCLSVFAISRFEIDSNKSTINSLNSDKVLDSSYLTLDDIDDVENNEEIDIKPLPSVKITPSENKTIESAKKEEVKEENKKIILEATSEPVFSLIDPTIDVNAVPVLATDTITMSHYGHDCGGCKTGKTASGYYIGDGNIYYNDKTFGSVRIVAADKKYPFGTILRLNGELAIVLDRGGVGDGKKFQIDLLVTSESESSKLGVKRNVSLEVLRLGY